MTTPARGSKEPSSSQLNPISFDQIPAFADTTSQPAARPSFFADLSFPALSIHQPAPEPSFLRPCSCLRWWPFQPAAEPYFLRPRSRLRCRYHLLLWLHLSRFTWRPATQTPTTPSAFFEAFRPSTPQWCSICHSILNSSFVYDSLNKGFFIYNRILLARVICLVFVNYLFFILYLYERLRDRHHIVSPRSRYIYIYIYIYIYAPARFFALTLTYLRAYPSLIRVGWIVEGWSAGLRRLSCFAGLSLLLLHNNVQDVGSMLAYNCNRENGPL